MVPFRIDGDRSDHGSVVDEATSVREPSSHPARRPRCQCRPTWCCRLDPTRAIGTLSGCAGRAGVPRIRRRTPSQSAAPSQWARPTHDAPSESGWCPGGPAHAISNYRGLNAKPTRCYRRRFGKQTNRRAEWPPWTRSATAGRCTSSEGSRSGRTATPRSSACSEHLATCWQLGSGGSPTKASCSPSPAKRRSIARIRVDRKGTRPRSGCVWCSSVGATATLHPTFPPDDSARDMWAPIVAEVRCQGCGHGVGLGDLISPEMK